MSKWLLILAAALLIIFLVAIGPLAVIWSWNTLFGDVLLIGYTVWTWLATAIFMIVLAPNVKVTKK